MSEHIREIMERCQRNVEEYRKNATWQAEVDARIAESDALHRKIELSRVREPAKPQKRYRNPADGSSFEV